MATQQLRHSGKLAVVTASTKGIGFATARRLANEGCAVLISSRRKENVDEAVEQLQREVPNGIIEGMVCNADDDSHRKDLYTYATTTFAPKYGNGRRSVDYLVNNVAINPVYGSLLETTLPVWDKVMRVNVRSAFHMMSLFGKEMVNEGRPGSIVNVSSVVSRLAMMGLGAYGVSKAALDGLTRASALELAPHNIRVNSVLPGVIETDFSKPLWEDEKSQVPRLLLAQTPMKRFGAPHEIAGVISFLLSDDASYITGEFLSASGGLGRH